MKILYCDDDTTKRQVWCEQVTAAWQSLRAKDQLSEDLDLQTCADITDVKGIPDSRSLSDAAGFDGFLLDLLWPTSDPDKDNPHGIEIAEALRKRYPEKAIMVFTVSAKPEFFDKLLNAGICGYLRKGEDLRALCFQITESMARHRKARGGQCLYKQLRKVTSSGDGWAAACVEKAATDVWNLDRSYDRWAAFWDAFQPPISNQRLVNVFSTMEKFFADNDLLTLGTLPGMRGHLDHVLNVYFTGYVISNRVPRFRECATAAAKRLLPTKHADIDSQEAKYWELFQLAWLAAATLHDTAYPLEILPDLLGKHWGITKDFGNVLSNIGEAPKPVCPDVLNAGLNEIALVLGTLYGDSRFHELLQKNAKFSKNGVDRVNHGVASGLLFLSLADKAMKMKDADADLWIYLKWAAAAMTLHSLKKPGSESKISISLEQDPLSYLLLACDEIQVWDRERPDASRMSSPFKGTDLSELSVTNDSVTACIDYTLHSGPAAASEFSDQRKSMDNKIEADNSELGIYLDGNGFSVKVDRRVPSLGLGLAPLRF